LFERLCLAVENGTMNKLLLALSIGVALTTAACADKANFGLVTSANSGASDPTVAVGTPLPDPAYGAPFGIGGNFRAMDVPGI
jgi:hypothetical protein